MLTSTIRPTIYAGVTAVSDHCCAPAAVTATYIARGRFTGWPLPNSNVMPVFFATESVARIRE